MCEISFSVTGGFYFSFAERVYGGLIREWWDQICIAEEETTVPAWCQKLCSHDLGMVALCGLEASGYKLNHWSTPWMMVFRLKEIERMLVKEVEKFWPEGPERTQGSSGKKGRSLWVCCFPPPVQCTFSCWNLWFPQLWSLWLLEMLFSRYLRP